jgi:DNA replication protein DnaC
MELFRTGEVIKPDFTEKRWINCNVSPEVFKAQFTRSVNTVMQSEGIKFDFKVDVHNKGFINQLYFYLNGSRQFKGDPNKGILLLGDIGCGKTFLMQTLFDMIEKLMSKVILQVHAKNIHTEIEAKGIEYFRKRPLFVDDIGKEEKEVKVYGSVHKPFEDLIAFRYANKGVTFGTGNFNMKTYEEMYFRHLTDRMKQLFNVMILPGTSRRN